MGPLYAYFLAFVIKIIGFGWTKIRLVQIIVGSASVVLVYQIAMQSFNNTKIAVSAAVFCLFWGVLIFYDTNLLMASLVVFLNLTLLLALLGLLKSSNSMKFFLPGVLLGISALARANILIFIPFCLFWFCKVFYSRFSAVVLAKKTAVFFLGIVLVILPVTIRNYFVEGDWILLTSNGGLNFYIGNNPNSEGFYTPFFSNMPFSSSDRLDIQVRKIADRSTGQKLTSSEFSNFWFNKAVEFIRQEPGKFFRNFLKKVALCWNEKEISQIESFYFYSKKHFILRVPLMNFGFIGPLALWGMILCFKKGNRQTQLLIYYLMAMTLAMALFFVSSRYRAPMVPVILILASFALHDFINRLCKREWIAAGKEIMGIGVFAILVHQPLYMENLAHDHFNQGSIYLRMGKSDKALEEFSLSLSLKPDYPQVYRARGMVYRKLNSDDKALAEFEKALSLNPDYQDVQTNIVLVYLEQSRLIEARKLLKEIQNKYSESYLSLFAEGRLLCLENQFEEAEKVLQKAINLSPEEPSAYYLLGIVYASQSLFDMAIGKFEKAIALAEKNSDANMYFNLGVCYYRNRRFQLAQDALTKATARDPKLTEAHTVLGQIYFKQGYIAKTIKEFEIAYRQQPNQYNRNNLDMARNAIGNLQ